MITNRYEINGDITTLIITSDTGETRYIFDTADLDLIKQYRWSIISTGYAGYVTKVDGKSTTIYLHRYIMDATERNQWVDHINGDIYNNRRINLRLVKPCQNCWNRGLSVANTSGCTGIYYYKDRDQWGASINYNNTRKYLGFFKDKEDAIAARKAAEKEYYGEFTRLD